MIIVCQQAVNTCIHLKWEHWLCKCGSVWKSALNSSVTNAASNQLLSQSLLKILITELLEIASQLHVTGDGAAETRGDDRMDGDTAGTVTDWASYPTGTNSSREGTREGKGKYVFTFQFHPHTGFLLDDRWHASHPAHCRYHSAQPLPPPPPLSPLHLAIASSQFYPIHAVYFSVSVSSVFRLSAKASARYVNEVNRIVACREAAKLSQKFTANFTLIQSAVACLPAFCVCVCVWMK